MEDLFSISYRSVTKLRDPAEGCAAILAESSTQNAKMGITSLLLYSGQHFIQTIEGPVHTVGKLFLKILADNRHVDVMPFSAVPITQRAFPAWPMKLIGISDTARIIPDMDQFDFTDESLADIHSAAKKLLRDREVA